jgi:long-chain acyl-CoA synthetase
MMIYTWQLMGVPIYYAENLAKIADNLVELKPTILTTVPRLLEKFYDKIIAVGRKQKGIKRKIFFWADKIAREYEEENQTFMYRTKLKLARKLVLNQWHNAFGGNFDVIISGGAAVQTLTCRIFYAMGITVLNGYGLTETSPVIAVSNFFKNGIKIGTVGPPLPGIEVTIAEDGEILTRGHCVMKGYFKEEVTPLDVIDAEGWFHTGDIGQFEKQGQITITGRKKEMFKTAFGKYVVPTIIENKFSEDSLIDSILVVGENKQFAAALIVPEFSDLRAWCARKGIEYTTNEEMIKHPEILKKYKKIVDYYNKSFGDTEKVKRFLLVDYAWSIETGELTPTLKLKRNFIMKKYHDTIESLFA